MGPHGLTITLDMALLIDHLQMHRDCICVWNPHMPSRDCKVHG